MVLQGKPTRFDVLRDPRGRLDYFSFLVGFLDGLVSGRVGRDPHLSDFWVCSPLLRQPIEFFEQFNIIQNMRST